MSHIIAQLLALWAAVHCCMFLPELGHAFISIIHNYFIIINIKAKLYSQK